MLHAETLFKVLEKYNKEVDVEEDKQPIYI